MSEGKNPKFFYGYTVALAAFLILVITQGTLYTFGVFFKPLSAEFGWTRAMTSGAFSLSTMLKGLFYIFTGILNDKIGPRVVMTGCGFFLGLGYLLMSRVNSIWQLYLFFGFIVAIGMSGGFVPMLSTVSRWFVKRRGLIIGVVAAGTGLGTLIVPWIANWLISSYDWRTSYTILGITALVIIVLAAQFLRRDPSQVGLLPYGQGEGETGHSGQDIGGFSFGQAIRTRQFWMLLVATLSFGFCMYAIMVHIVPHATDLGISAVNAANIIAIIGGANVVGRIMMGGTGDRIGSKKAFALCFILMSFSLALLVVTRELWIFYLFGFAFGFAFGGMLALMALLVADLFGLLSHGVILGSAAFGIDIGGAVGPVLAGHIFDTTGSYQLVFLACVGVSIAGLTVMALLPPPSKKAPRFSS